MPGGNCEQCGIYRKWLHRHHIKPRHEGGTDADGIALICANCHEDEHGSPFGQSVRAARRRAEREKAVPADQLRALYGAGLSIREIARTLGTSPSNVGYWMEDYGIERRGVGRREKPRPTSDELRRLYEDELMSLAEVGKRCDVTAATVQSWLVADGVRVRSRSESAKLRGAKRKAERERVVADILADHQVLPS